MASVIRGTLIVMVGFVAASIVMMIVETINGTIIYPELRKSAAGVKDRQQIKEIMANAPTGAFVVVLVGWALGSALGGLMTTVLSRKPAGGRVFTLALLLTLAGIANNLMLPPPLWFWFATFAVLPTATYAGARIVAPKRPEQTDYPSLQLG